MNDEDTWRIRLIIIGAGLLVLLLFAGCSKPVHRDYNDGTEHSASVDEGMVNAPGKDHDEGYN